MMAGTRRVRWAWTGIAVAGVLFAPLAMTAAPDDSLQSAESVDYTRDIEPILVAQCVECHGPAKRRGGLRLDTPGALQKGGVSGPAVAPGDADASLLIRRVVGAGDQKRMPLNREPLTAEQIAVLRLWVTHGARAPDRGASPGHSAEREHWAYVAPTRSAEPAVRDASWPRNAIDRFVLARLEHEGMAPSPEADRAALLRRICLDLTGLPPTAVQSQRFLADERPDAYERFVDELLASPHFGERWAMHWLDLARYADSNGYEKDLIRSMWPYRDWVIDALNRDMPFDQFTIEQLAGDLLPGATDAQRIATGFHRNTQINEEGGTDPEESRSHAVVDRVNTTATVWLGSTVACAQCHNHKFDPFSQADYYRLYAFFNQTEDETYRNASNDVFDKSPKMRVPLPDEPALRERLASLERERDADTPEFRAALEEWAQSQLGEVRWTVVQPAEFDAISGAGVVSLPDGSTQLVGVVPYDDTYVVVLELSRRATALRIEVMQYELSPANGPGRTTHGNFVLSELRASLSLPGMPSEPVEFAAPAADHEQINEREDYSIGRAVDGQPGTGWAIAPQYGKPHHAVFPFKTPIDPPARGPTRLTLTIEQNYGYQHTIGRMRFSLTDDERDPRRDALPDELRAALSSDATVRSDAQAAALAEYFRARWPRLSPVREEIAAIRRKLDAAPTTLVMQERAEPRETYVHLRGNFLDHGERVEPDTPRVLHPFPADAPRNRMGLARWLVDDANPLTARVVMNRIWEQLWGRGIVATSEDFGSQGDAPSHAELLDWLAVEFRESRWSLKHMLRLMVTSATYRQSSRITPELLERDPHNGLLARSPRLRLEPELLRDQALAVSGLLSERMGGPSVMPYQPPGIWAAASSSDNNKWQTSGGDDRWRRGVYTFWRRSSPYPSFVAFDAPNREACCTRRSRTNTPLQALVTMNDPEFIAPAAALARRVMHECAGDDAARIDWLYRAALARPPRDAETSRLLALLSSQRAALRRDAAAAAKLADAGLGIPPGTDPAELAAWTVVANVLMNLDEFLTRG